MPRYDVIVEYTTQVSLEVEAEDIGEAHKRAEELALVEGGSAPSAIVVGPTVISSTLGTK